MILPGRLRERLSDALQIAYPSYIELKQLLSYGVDVNIDTITPNGPLGDVVLEIIKWVYAREQVEELFEAACERNPKNTALREAHHVLLTHLALLDAFETYELLYNIVVAELGIDSNPLTPVGWVRSAEDYAKAVYRLIEQVEATHNVDIAQLLTAVMSVRSSNERIRNANKVINPKTSGEARDNGDQHQVERIANILRQHHLNRYIGESYSHFRQVLQTIRTLRISDAYGTLHDALERLQDETDTDEPNRVARYQECFHLATEDDEEAVLKSFTDTYKGFDEQLLGNPEQPLSALIFGSAGHGKTAYCKRTAQSARTWALVVQIDIDKQVFGEVFGEENGWLKYIRHRTIETLEQALLGNTPRQDELQNNPQALEAFHREKMFSGAPPTTDLGRDSKNSSTDLLASLEQLSKTICQSAGYNSVYVLVDMKDERHHDTEQLKIFFQPLLTMMQQASDIGYAIKLFLPARLKDPIAKQSEPLKIFDLSWQPAQLEMMLSKYIASRDSSAKTRSFAQLCTRDLPFVPDACLAAAAMDRVTRNYSPRRMMALAWSIINLHLARYPNSKHFINAATIEAVLGNCSEPAPTSG